MKVECPKCHEWMESTDEVCPFCHAALNREQYTTWLPHSFFVKKRIKRVILVIILLLCIWGIVAFIQYINEEDELKKIYGGQPYYMTFEGCLPPYDTVEIPENADDATILKMSEELYQAHLDHTDCAVPPKTDVSWATRIGSGWLSKENEERMANNPRYAQILNSKYDDHSFMKGYQGCHGFPISTLYDRMQLYIRSHKKGHIEMAFMQNATLIGSYGDPYPKRDHYMEQSAKFGNAPYTVHTPDRPVAPIYNSRSASGVTEEVPYPLGVDMEPVHKSPVLYGVDQEHYTQGILKQIKDTPYFSFYSGEDAYLHMKNGHTFKVVFLVQRGTQKFIIYRVYPLSHDIKTDAQFFDEACNF